MATAHQVRIERIYGDQSSSIGARVLVDRLWPRGVSKERAHLDVWLRDVSPSTELREWYEHDPAKLAEFTRRYHAELQDPERSAALDELRKLARHGPVTLLTASKALDISHAAVLRDLLEQG